MSILNVTVTPNFESSYYLVILSLVMFVALAYITTVLLKKSKLGGKGKNIHVIERFYLSADKILMIVKVGEVYYLMSYDKTGMKMMDKLENFTPNEIELTQPKFSDLLEKVKLNKEQ